MALVGGISSQLGAFSTEHCISGNFHSVFRVSAESQHQYEEATLCSVLCPLYSVLWTLYSVLDTLYFVLEKIIVVAGYWREETTTCSSPCSLSVIFLVKNQKIFHFFQFISYWCKCFIVINVLGFERKLKIDDYKFLFIHFIIPKNCVLILFSPFSFTAQSLNNKRSSTQLGTSIGPLNGALRNIH